MIISGESGGGQTFLAKEAPQTRLLCITVRRAKHGRGFKPSLHLLRPPGHEDGPGANPGPAARRQDAAAAASAAADPTSAATGAKSFPLKALTDVSLPASKYESHPSNVLELQFARAAGAVGGGAALGRSGSTGGASSASAAAAAAAADGGSLASLKMGSREELQLLVAIVLALVNQGGYRPPRLSGLDAGEVHAWWLGQQGAVLPALGAFAAAVLLPGGGEEEEAAGGGGGGPRVLLSGKEESQLEELLGLFALGVGDGEEFRARLQEEHEALEAANVQALMSCLPAAEAVVAAIRGTQGMLEDLDETLAVFDTKLRHMRADIAAIEASNNALERHARNNGALRATLQDLLSSLRLPADVEAVLEAPPFGKGSRLPLITSAAWQLHATLSRLDPDPHPEADDIAAAAAGAGGGGAHMSPYLLQLRVVQEARESLASLRSRFVTSALTALRGLVRGEVEGVLAVLAANTDRASRLLPPSHDRLRSACGRHAELVRSLGALEPASLPRLAGEVVAAVNILLRKELRVSVSELRKAAQLDMHVGGGWGGVERANPIDYALTGHSAARVAAGAGAGGSVLGSKPPGSVLGASVLGSSEDPGDREEVGSTAAASDFGLATGLAFGVGGPGSIAASRQSRSTFLSAWSR
ncbi:hypothetical protein GPECTOR_27g692 [Gonium pectorale]|uniref:Exocyst complex component Sec3 coiled-coil domain-containing protein n=1 Tax=Gonium pectorale TaxID=33097 RepID=A0A150GF89_GONPE|nr:hypothetical protein GPECTOR_27g692 [Gonium pectorale]|eukprot:KXZ48521.1 hypothetical protein GPECTOR_27g692 [Gonium pectorale]